MVWPIIIGGAVPLIVWLVRLEAMAISMRAQNQELKADYVGLRKEASEQRQHVYDKMEQIGKSMEGVVRSLGKIEGRLEGLK